MARLYGQPPSTVRPAKVVIPQRTFIPMSLPTHKTKIVATIGPASESLENPECWREFARQWLREQSLAAGTVMLAAGPSERHPDANHRLEFMH
jgi:hypothetical protein